MRTARLTFSEKVGFGLGDAGFNFYWVIIGSYLIFFYTDIFGLSAKAAATMVTVTKLIDALTDPVMGAVADRTHSRWGKFRPYLLFGALPMMGAAVLALSTPDLEGPGKLIWAYVTYSLMMLTYTILSTPYSSLSAVMTADTQERSHLNSVRFFFAYFTGILVGAATPELALYFGDGDRTSAHGWQMVMIVYSTVATVCFLITFLTTKERIPPPPTQRTNPVQDIKDLLNNKAWLILFVLAMIIMVTFTLRGSSAAYYFKYFVQRPDLLGVYVGLQMAGLMIGAMLASTMIRFIEKKRLLMLLMAIVGVLSLLFWSVPKPSALGVVEIPSDTPITLHASDLLGAPDQPNASFSWTRHEPVFWILKKRVELDENTPSITLSEQAGSVISVMKSFTDNQGNRVRVDSSDWPVEIIWMFVLNILISLALGPKAPITWAMYADTADYNEWKTGRRATAMTFSATTFSQKIGNAIGSAVMLTVLAAMGYQANEVQSGASVNGIIAMQTVAPGIFALIAVFTLRFYDLSDDRINLIQRDLERRDLDRDDAS